MRDQHFSIISSYIKRLENKKRITNINEILDCLNSSQKESNINRSKNGLIEINYLALLLPQEKTIKTGFLEISQLESLYNVQNVRSKNGMFRICTSVFSDLKNLIPITATVGQQSIIKKKHQSINLLEEPSEDFQYLINKHQNIKNDLERIQRFKDKSKLNDQETFKEKNYLYEYDDNNDEIDNLDPNDQNDVNTDDYEKNDDNRNKNDQNIEEDDEQYPDITQNSFIPNESDIPEHCFIENIKRHDGACVKHCYYTIAELMTIGQKRLIDELIQHGHPGSLKKNKKKFFKTDERRQELIAHYTIYHRKS